MPWYIDWGWGLWIIIPMLMCVGMMVMMMLLGRGRMGRGCMSWCGGLTQQEYEEQRKLLVKD